MHTDTLVFITFLIFTGAAILSTAALFTRQSLLVAYILVGAILGPWGLKLVADPSLVKQIGEVGILFLLFLLGLHLHPQNLIGMLRKVTVLSVISSVAFAAAGYAVGYFFGFNPTECMVLGAAMMFSSTIIGLKLLPTTIMHHQHTGEVMISVLLMQDLIAIIVLLIIHGADSGGFNFLDFGLITIGFPLLLGFAYLAQRFILIPLFTRFDRTQEYIFLLSIGWCLGMAELSRLFGLSEEIGAFIAGVALAASPIALYIAESLKPLRDFFLVMFFFSVGAGFNFQYWNVVFIPALILAALSITLKPLVFSILLRRIGETKQVASEVGWRLGQNSEFSLLVASLAVNSTLISHATAYLIQATTIFTFLISSYIVVMRYPTPIAISDKLRRD